MIAKNMIANPMFRNLQRILGAILALVVVTQASAFSTFGPLEAFQTTTLDYGTRYYYGNDIELGGPKNFGQGSRLNVPIITYAYDYTFLSYFGAKGVAAVDAAMNEMNSLPAATAVNLAHFATQGNQQINYTAQALSLTDLKTTVMSLMIEHMGLLGETHVWDLAYRDPTPVTCEYGYGVINRNYDPATYNPTRTSTACWRITKSGTVVPMGSRWRMRSRPRPISPPQPITTIRRWRPATASRLGVIIWV